MSHTAYDRTTGKQIRVSIPRDARSKSEAAYHAEQDRIDAAIDALKARLAAHAQRAADRHLDWGFAGDLSEVRRQLEQAVEFLGGPSR